MRQAHPLARLLNETKKPGQRVRAVGLGQTDRFGSRFPERNPVSRPLPGLSKYPSSCICGLMKITIDLPDDVFLKAKILAAERGMTFTDVVIQGLKLVTQTPPEAVLKKRKAQLKRHLKAMQASNTEPMVPLKREEIYDR